MAAGIGASRHTDPTGSFYMISRFWELAVRVLLYQCMALSRHSFGRPAASASFVRQILAVTSTLAMVAVGVVISDPLHFPFPGAILPAIGTLRLVGLLHGMNAGLLLRVSGIPSNPIYRA